MQKPDRSVYTPQDFLVMQDRDGLSLTPKFQRRAFWKPAARSFLIDTLVRQMPVPPIYLRLTQDPTSTRVIREVIDGQQRIKAVLDFLADDYALSRTLDGEHAGKRFSQLSQPTRDRITRYGFSCEVFQDLSDQEVLEIFRRLNTYAVPLNAQELRNGRYFGYFKQTSYALAEEHVEFWRQNKIFSEESIARMLEVELTSELLIAALDGMQDKKKSIDRFYANLDENFPGRTQIKQRFRAVIDSTSETFQDFLTATEFRRPPLFYTLFCVVYHRTFGLPRQRMQTPRRPLTAGERHNLLDATLLLSDTVSAARADEPVPDRYVSFVNACLRQTDNVQPRQTRFAKLYSTAF